MKKKMNNKGFSLVELIIVVAIMVLLVGVLAPQYMKYVEKSRESADLDNIQAMISAVQVYNSDPAHTPISGTITGDSTDGYKIEVTGIGAALTDAGINVTNMTFKSTKYRDDTVTISVSGGITTVTATADVAGALGLTTTPTS